MRNFKKFEIPEVLKQTHFLNLKTPLPISDDIIINNSIPTLLYNFYNLDPVWKKNLKANKILLIEPSHFEEYPVCQKSIDFLINLAKKNIPSIQIYVGEFKDLIKYHFIRDLLQRASNK